MSKNPSVAKIAANRNADKPINKQKEDMKDTQNITQADSSKDKIGQEIKISEAKIEGIPDSKKEILAFGLTRAEIEAKIPVMEEEIKTEMIRINSIGDKIQEYVQSGQNGTDPEVDKWCAEADKEVREAWKDLYFNKISLYISYRIQLIYRIPSERKNFKHPLAEGGSLYELAQHLPYNVNPRDFDNRNFHWVDDNQ